MQSQPNQQTNADDKAQKAAELAQKQINEFYTTEIGCYSGLNDFIKAITDTRLIECLPDDKQQQFKDFLWPYQSLNQLKPFENPTREPDLRAQVNGLIATVNSDDFKVKQGLMREISMKQDQFLDFINSLNKLPQVKANNDAMKFLLGQEPYQGKGPLFLMMQPAQRGMRYGTLLEATLDRLEKADPALKTHLAPTEDLVKTHINQTNAMIADRKCKAITLPMIKEFEAQLTKLNAECNQAKPSPSTIQKRDALTTLLNGIKEAGNDIQTIRDYLYLAQKMPELTTSRGILASDTKKLINNHLTRVEASIGKSADNTRLDATSMNLASYYAQNSTAKKSQINPIPSTLPPAILPKVTDTASNIMKDPIPTTVKNERTAPVSNDTIKQMVAHINTKCRENFTSTEEKAGKVTLQAGNRQFQVDKIAHSIVNT